MNSIVRLDTRGRLVVPNEFREKLDLKEGDEVIISSGKDKGKKGKIEKIYPNKDSVLLPGLNIFKKHLKKRDEKNPLGTEIGYRPPHYTKVGKLLDEFIEWYNATPLNPLEKAAQAHYKLYKIHPFLDGNKITAFEATRIFLRLNGYDIGTSDEKKYSFVIRIAEKELSIIEITDWLRKHTKGK